MNAKQPVPPIRRISRGSVHRTADGFTLMEVMLVLVILVILGSMAAGLFTGVQEQSSKKAAEAQIGIFKRAIRLYQLNLNQFPNKLEDLVQQPSGLKNPDKWTKLIDESKLPVDPWENEYKFAAPGTHNADGFDVWSTGPDGSDGTEDDIGNW